MIAAAIAWSFSRGGICCAVGLGDELEQDVPALEEQRVEHLVLRAEVVVDEAVGDVRLVGDVRHAALVKAALGERDDGGVEDQAALVGAGGSRRIRPGPRPASGTPTGGGWRARAARGGCAPGRRGRGRRRCAPSRSAASASTIPHGSTIIERPPERSAGASRARGRVLADLVGGDDERLVLDRARAQEDLPVVARRRDGEGRGHGEDARAADREDPVQLGEADVVADRQAEPDAARASAMTTISSPACSWSDSR